MHRSTWSDSNSEQAESTWWSQQKWDNSSWDDAWYPASSGGWNAASSGGWNKDNWNTCRDWQNSQWNERADDCHNNAWRNDEAFVAAARRAEASYSNDQALVAAAKAAATPTAAQRNIEAQMAPKAAERWQAAAPPEAPAT